MDDLLRWAAENGVSDTPTSKSPEPPSPCLGHSLIVAHFPDAGGRGLAAARDLRKGEMVLHVPRAVLLTRENVFSMDPNLAICVQRHSSLTPAQILIVCLLAEVGKARKSWWYPYLTQLPRSYDVLAIFTNFETQAFQVDNAIWLSERAVWKAKMDWEQAVNLMQEIGLRPQLLSFKSWVWASATVSSRALHVPWDSAGCLCPVGDLFNYDAPDGEESEEVLSLHSISILDDNDCGTVVDHPDNSSSRLTDGCYEEVRESYCFYARKGYRKDEQVLLGYGTYTNIELLEYYGFLLELNPNDKAFMSLEAQIRASNWPKDSLYIQQNGRPSYSMISTLRLWATPKNLRRAAGHLAYSGARLSVDNEIAVMQYLSKCCKITLQKLPTSIGEDQELLDVIDKTLKNSSHKEFAAVRSCSTEVGDFLQANGMCNGLVDAAFPSKVRRSMERWRLAVKWRAIYKTSLLNCITHCNEVINRLTNNHI